MDRRGERSVQGIRGDGWVTARAIIDGTASGLSLLLQGDGVQSVTRPSAGRYIVNLSPPMPSAEYVVLVMARNRNIRVGATGQTNASMVIETFNFTTATQGSTDRLWVEVKGWR